MNNTIENIIPQNMESEIVDLISAVVACPSHSGIENQETQTAEAFKDFFLKEGIEAETHLVADGRKNVIARLKGQGAGKTLLLTGHIDTVPPYDMEGDPYAVRIEDGKMYGRGVVDMKGALACMAYAMVAIKKSGIPLEGDVVFAGVIDEEEKSLGTIALIEQGMTFDAAVVGEPTNMEVCSGHRGLEWFEFFFQGKTVHGGRQKEGINAIQKAVKFVDALEKDLIPVIEKRVHPLAGSSTMNYGYILGGTQPSTVAGECVLKIDRRWLPEETYETVTKEYQDILYALAKEDPQFKVSLKVMEESLMKEGYVHEALDTDEEQEIVKICQNQVEIIFGEKKELRFFSAWTDGGLLSKYAHIPTVILGPGELESAHSKIEHLEVETLIPATRIYAGIILEFCK